MPNAVNSRTRTIGVDIGGTKVAAGFVDAQGEITQHTRMAMNPRGTAEEGLAAVTTAIDMLLKMAPEARGGVQGIGICAPGPLDPQTGLVLNPPNVPCWRNFPLAAEISRRYGGFVRIDNDANAAGLAEGLWGAGRGYKNVFYAGIGTGIGTGILFDGRIYYGRTGAAAEGGHVSIDYKGPRCGCGKRGCIEVLASGTAIGKKARARLAEKAGCSAMMLELAGGNVEAITSEIVGRAYTAGDPLAKEILLETVELLAIWLGNIVDLMEPEVMVLGGGVATMLSLFFRGNPRPLASLVRECALSGDPAGGGALRRECWNRGRRRALCRAHASVIGGYCRQDPFGGKFGLKKYDRIGLLSYSVAAPPALEAIQPGFATIRCKGVGREFEPQLNFRQLKMICN